MKDKIKSYSFWTALSGAVVVLLQALGDCFGFSIQSEVVSGIIMAIAGILVVLVWCLCQRVHQKTKQTKMMKPSRKIRMKKINKLGGLFARFFLFFQQLFQKNR